MLKASNKVKRALPALELYRLRGQRTEVPERMTRSSAVVNSDRVAKAYLRQCAVSAPKTEEDHQKQTEAENRMKARR